LTTGRTVYQFHTRTKTGRAPQLNDAAPDSWVELSNKDAAAVGVTEGDIVRVESRRGAFEGRVRISGVRPGVIFVPFHYGYWDLAADTGPGDSEGQAPAPRTRRRSPPGTPCRSSPYSRWRPSG
jgi:anaerobic selenocysteine-containing dehydrogenase